MAWIMGSHVATAICTCRWQDELLVLRRPLRTDIEIGRPCVHVTLGKLCWYINIFSLQFPLAACTTWFILHSLAPSQLRIKFGAQSSFVSRPASEIFASSGAKSVSSQDPPSLYFKPQKHECPSVTHCT